MTIYGTARPLFARVEIGQNRVDLFARFEVGQDFENLNAVFAVRMSTTIDLNAITKVHHLGSAEIYAHCIVKAADSAETYGHAEIQHPASIDLYAYFYRGGGSLQDLYGKVEIQHPASVELYGKLEVIRASSSVPLYAHAEIQHSTFVELYANFNVGQDAQELYARAEVGQGTAELYGYAEIVNDAFQDLLVKVVITHSIELYGKLVVTRIGAVQNLPVFFEVGQNYEDLYSHMLLGQSTHINFDGEFIVRHTGAPVELYSYAIIRNVSSAELYAKFETQAIVDLYSRVRITLSDSVDLFAKLIVGPVHDSYVYLVCDDPASWINVVMGIGQGFITIPWVEADTVVKMCGNSSARLTSNYSPQQYKEIRFGWNGLCIGGVDFRREVLEQSVSEISAKATIRHIREDFKDLYASFEVVGVVRTYVVILPYSYNPFITTVGTDWTTVLESRFYGDSVMGDAWLLNWDAMIRTWVPGAYYSVKITLQHDGEDKVTLGYETSSRPPAGWVWDGLAAGIFPIALTRSYLIFSGYPTTPFTIRVEMKASSGAFDVMWQYLTGTYTFVR